MTVSANTISKIVAEVSRLHGEIVSSANKCLAKAIQIGEILSEVKLKLDHGDWLPWARNLPFTERTARNYMRIYDNRETINQSEISDISEAYQLLADPKPKSAPPTPRKTDETAAPYATKIAPEKPSEKSNVNTPKSETVSDLDQKNPEKSPVSHPREQKTAKSVQPKTEQTPRGMVDGTGLEIPEMVRPAWALRYDVQEAMTYLSNLRTFLRRHVDANHKLLACPDAQPIVCDLDNAFARLRNIKPHAVCPTCLGKQPEACAMCHGLGLVSQWFWQNCVPVETREMRKKFVASLEEKANGGGV